MVQAYTKLIGAVEKRYLLGAVVLAFLIIAALLAIAYRPATPSPLPADFSGLLAETASAAAVDMFLKIDGIEGESADRAHRGEIDIESWSWGETQSGGRAVGGGSGVGKVNMQDFHLVMKVSKASPQLMVAVAEGKHFPKAVLTVRKAGGEQPVEYLKWTFSDALISSYQTSMGSNDVIPMDSISLNFGKIEQEYRPQNPDGSLGSPTKGCWDLQKNQKC